MHFYVSDAMRFYVLRGGQSPHLAMYWNGAQPACGNAGPAAAPGTSRAHGSVSTEWRPPLAHAHRSVEIARLQERQSGASSDLAPLSR
jgi:hypothetical protein